MFFLTTRWRMSDPKNSKTAKTPKKDAISFPQHPAGIYVNANFFACLLARSLIRSLVRSIDSENTGDACKIQLKKAPRPRMRQKSTPKSKPSFSYMLKPPISASSHEGEKVQSLPFVHPVQKTPRKICSAEICPRKENWKTKGMGKPRLPAFRRRLRR